MNSNKSKSIFLLAAAIIIIALITGVAAFSGNNSSDESYYEENSESGFIATTYTGKKVSYSNDYAGKPLLINFSGTWCGPCKIEYPELQDLYENHSDEISLLVISSGDSLEIVQDFYPANSYTFDVVPDPTGEIADLYGISGFPTSLLIDAEGRIVDTHVGATTVQGIFQMLEISG